MSPYSSSHWLPAQGPGFGTIVHHLPSDATKADRAAKHRQLVREVNQTAARLGAVRIYALTMPTQLKTRGGVYDFFADVAFQLSDGSFVFVSDTGDVRLPVGTKDIIISSG